MNITVSAASVNGTVTNIWPASSEPLKCVPPRTVWGTNCSLVGLFHALVCIFWIVLFLCLTRSAGLIAPCQLQWCPPPPLQLEGSMPDRDSFSAWSCYSLGLGGRALAPWRANSLFRGSWVLSASFYSTAACAAAATQS